MKDYLGQKPAHTEVAVNITPSPLSCGSHHLTALTWDLRQKHLQKNSETRKSNKGWKLNSVVQLPQNESLKHNSSSTRKPLWVEGLHPQHPSWPPLRGRSHMTPEPRSWYYVPYSQPGTSSIPELLRPEWCGAKGRIWSERPGLRSLALLLTLLVCGQITVPLWLRFFTAKWRQSYPFPSLWGLNKKIT